MYYYNRYIGNQMQHCIIIHHKSCSYPPVPLLVLSPGSLPPSSNVCSLLPLSRPLCVLSYAWWPSGSLPPPIVQIPPSFRFCYVCSLISVVAPLPPSLLPYALYSPFFASAMCALSFLLPLLCVAAPCPRMLEHGVHYLLQCNYMVSIISFHVQTWCLDMVQSTTWKTCNYMVSIIFFHDEPGVWTWCAALLGK